MDTNNYISNDNTSARWLNFIFYFTHFVYLPISVFGAINLHIYIHLAPELHDKYIEEKALILSSDATLDNNTQPTSSAIEEESRENKIIKSKLEKWVARKGFTKQGLTMDDLALELATNRTYLSSYINAVYHHTFRGWIASQRIEYSKELLLQNDDLSSATIAAKVGYSPNAFIKIFTKTEGVPPVQWRNENR